MKRLIFSTAKLVEVPAPKYLSASEIADLNIKTEVFRKSKNYPCYNNFVWTDAPYSIPTEIHITIYVDDILVFTNNKSILEYVMEKLKRYEYSVEPGKLHVDMTIWRISTNLINGDMMTAISKLLNQFADYYIQSKNTSMVLESHQ